MMEATMRVCSISKELEIVPGDMNDYAQLAAYHYRSERPVAVKAVYVLRPRRPLGPGPSNAMNRVGEPLLGRRPAGVIVYTMPNPRVALRAVATGRRFADLDRHTELELLNRSIRCIARVIVEPRLRGIGLAARLVRETMPALEVPMVEALGVMPRVNPFLEKAGMRAFEGIPNARDRVETPDPVPRVPVEHVKLLAALDAVQIDERDLISPEVVQTRFDALPRGQRAFIERYIAEFLKSHGTRRTMPPGLERTRYILGKLTHRPVYYIWFNPSMVDETITHATPKTLSEGRQP